MKYAMLVYSDQSSWEGLSGGGGAATAGRIDAALDQRCSTRWARRTRTCRAGSSPRPARRRSSASSTVGRSSPTGRSPRRRSSSAASSSPTCPTSTRRSGSPRSSRPSEYGTLEIRPLITPVTAGLAAIYAEEWPRCVAILTRVLGDLERAEDAVQDAFTTALERWPRTGVPDNPGAWIVTDRPQPSDRPDPT